MEITPFENFINITPKEFFNIQEEFSQSVMPRKREESEERKKRNNFLYTPMGIGLLFVLCGFFIWRNPTIRQKLSIKLKKISKHLDKIVYNSRHSVTAGIMRKITIKISNAIDYLNNLAPLKDMWCERIISSIRIGKFNIGQRICTATKKYFEELTVNSHFKITAKNMRAIDKRFEKILEIIEKAIKNAPIEKQAELKELSESIQKNRDNCYDTFGGLKGFKTRLSEFYKSIATLPQLVKEKLRFSNYKRINGYVTDQLTQPERMKQLQELKKVRNSIIYTKLEQHKEYKKIINEFELELDTRDIAIFNKCFTEYTGMSILTPNGMKTLNQFKDKMQVLYGNSNPQKAEEISQKIDLFETKYSAYMQTAQKKTLLTQINEKTTQYLDEQDVKELNKYTTDIGNYLDKCINSEMRVYQKFGEIKLGSAFTDIASLLGTVGIGAFIIAKPNNKDEHIEAALRQGFPILGALGALLYCTSRMIPNFRALIIGTVSGYIIKKVGDKAADKYVDISEKYKRNKELIAEYNKIKRQQIAKHAC